MNAEEQLDIDPAIYRRRWAILAVLCTSLMIVIIGNTTLNVALPTLARELDASTSSLQWMVDAYALVFAGLLFTAATLGDRFGRKGALQAGLVVFLFGTILASTSDTSTVVIGARAVMGLAAAFVMPSTLSILTNVFPARERPKAIAVWAGISGGGAAIGPVASGYLLEHFYWGSVFLVNVPLIVGAFVAGAFLVPRSRDPHKQPLDLPGAGLSIVALSALVYSIIEGPAHGWLSATSLFTFSISAVAMAAFIWRERTARFPMLELRLFRDRRFSVASGGMTLTFFAMFGTFFLVAQYFQLVLGYSPLESGLLQLPMAFVMMGLAPQIPRVVVRFGTHRVVPAGLGFIALGLAVFSQVGTSTPVWFIYFAVLPLAAGMATTMTPLTTLIMSSVPMSRAGVGSAMNDTTRELGGALGVAVLGSLVTSQFSNDLGPALGGLPESARSVADSGLTGALAVAEQMGGPAGEALADTARQAFVNGISVAAMVGAVVVITAAIASWRLLPASYQVGGRPTGPDDDAEPGIDPNDDSSDPADLTTETPRPGSSGADSSGAESAPPGVLAPAGVASADCSCA